MCADNNDKMSDSTDFFFGWIRHIIGLNSVSNINSNLGLNFTTPANNYQKMKEFLMVWMVLKCICWKKLQFIPD